MKHPNPCPKCESDFVCIRWNYITEYNPKYSIIDGICYDCGNTWLISKTKNENYKPEEPTSPTFWKSIIGRGGVGVEI